MEKNQKEDKRGKKGKFGKEKEKKKFCIMRNKLYLRTLATVYIDT